MRKWNHTHSIEAPIRDLPAAGRSVLVVRLINGHSNVCCHLGNFVGYLAEETHAVEFASTNRCGKLIKYKQNFCRAAGIGADKERRAIRDHDAHHHSRACAYALIRRVGIKQSLPRVRKDKSTFSRSEGMDFRAKAQNSIRCQRVGFDSEKSLAMLQVLYSTYLCSSLFRKEIV